jgi:beta-lactamase superfamily II metal-dependent hydrolase
MKGTLLFLALALSMYGFCQQPGKPLPPWSEGMLDLHHINTGRGDAALYIFPDGTTFVLDAGEMPPAESPRRTQLRPNDSKPAYQWITLYARKFMAHVSGEKIDYALITHFHNDHLGGYYNGAPRSAAGGYALSGITGLGDELHIGTVIDRGYPDYKFPGQLKAEREKFKRGEVPAENMMTNYWAFLEYQMKHSGMKVEQLRAGRSDQIVPVHDRRKFPAFKVNNIKSNGTIWTGRGTETFEQFAPYSDSMRISENQFSNAIRIDYGNFRYYTGGDNPGIADLGQPARNDVETPIARAVGAVDVAVMDHHGNRDSENEFLVKTLHPRVWVEQTWSSDHPGHEVLRRVTSHHLYDGPRDLFATNIMEANKVVIGPALERAYKSMQGHILVRVMPGGDEYYVIILNDSNTENEVTAVFGPYQATKK